MDEVNKGVSGSTLLNVCVCVCRLRACAVEKPANIMLEGLVRRLWGVVVGHPCGALLQDTLMGGSCRTPFWAYVTNPAYQRQAAFTHACFPFPKGTDPRKYTFHRGRVKPHGTAASRTQLEESCTCPSLAARQKPESKQSKVEHAKTMEKYVECHTTGLLGSLLGSVLGGVCRPPPRPRPRPLPTPDRLALANYT